MVQSWSPVLTADGSFTFYSAEFEQAFHSTSGARQEALHKFVLPSGLLDRPAPIRVLDICYGLGYNSAALLDALWQVRPAVRVEILALERDLTIPRAAWGKGWLAGWPRAEMLLGHLAQTGAVETEPLAARLIVGDARQTIQQVPPAWADGIFLDPFSPERCPMLWSVEFLRLVARRLQPDGTLVSYACGAAARRALQLGGLFVGSTKPVGRRSPGTVANHRGGLPPLSRREEEHLLTRAAVPYRDPDLNADAVTLQQRRAAEQAGSALEPTSRWKRRWALRKNAAVEAGRARQRADSSPTP
ncbi:tRNA (5-methylaminomethyl-2-thiouridine)(34)-methyltransferase MnmD [Gloeobacter kilaueensis]|uniref:Bifunctional tRNA (Mnm(5)s(2)U34)-methyltransferase/FAD-dependent cmnm(5)s(2)U34 oxidoreductase n=1 Tax=Gloeobacter kilaueensis (strain ATCC BAA-2537 / CCAP 1431/1 / ULC 316 / JS1) TaxID=1183438 RepID=U5QM27_GLOK1|nr:MnmC family methyltransferase [Gloeobacter kilaueensis]AGY60037.1 bifunctional tRNA (mnm(5)s(2)U34)-methyltransferase/FAD-dependent cmnm(5)s(2)U34 oxidoreductase [Gloeobacter kilaueensis JS1]